MASLYNRKYKIQLISRKTGLATVITELKIVFEVTKDLVGFPNLGKIDLYNLSEDTVNKIEKDDLILLDAGYENSVKQLFSGTIRNIVHTRSSVDKITTMYAGDGNRELDDSIFAKTFAAGFNVKKMFLEVVKSFGIPIDKLKINGKSATLTGMTLTGKTKDVLDKLAKQYDLNWSIQDGNINIFGVNDADTEIPLTLINSGTGMIGSPALTEIGSDVRTLLNPILKPNGLIKIESTTPEVNIGNLFFRNVKRTLGNGVFRINKVVHQGDSRGQAWQSVITSQRLII